MTYKWQQWLRKWRAIAENSTLEGPSSIVIASGGRDYGVLSVSKFDREYHRGKPHVKTSGQDFSNDTTLFSEATRDLGIMRIIYDDNILVFVIEPGPDVIEWRASTEGVSEKSLLKVMRNGDLGRRIRGREPAAVKNLQSRLKDADRKAADALGRLQEIIAQHKKESEQWRISEGGYEDERNEMKRQIGAMQANIESLNEKLSNYKGAPQSSGTMTSPLGKAGDRGTMLTSTKRLPGNFEGRK